MLLENTENNRQIKRVLASMAIENMYLDEQFIREVMKVDNNEKTYEELIQDVINEYSCKEGN